LGKKKLKRYHQGKKNTLSPSFQNSSEIRSNKKREASLGGSIEKSYASIVKKKIKYAFQSQHGNRSKLRMQLHVCYGKEGRPVGGGKETSNAELHLKKKKKRNFSNKEASPVGDKAKKKTVPDGERGGPKNQRVAERSQKRNIAPAWLLVLQKVARTTFGRPSRRRGFRAAGGGERGRKKGRKGSPRLYAFKKDGQLHARLWKSQGVGQRGNRTSVL